MARELRRRGSRDAAERVRGLRKPSVPAWALNQVARRRADRLGAFLDAGEELRRAQGEVLAGRGGRDRLRTAVEAERAAIDALVDDVREILAAESRKPTPQVLDRTRDTLHAASGDERVRELLEAGRLVEDAKPVGLGGAEVAAPPPRRRGKDKLGKRRQEEVAAAKRRREELAAARAEVRKAEQRAKKAVNRVREAQAELDSARSEVDSADADLERKRDALARLEEHSG